MAGNPGRQTSLYSFRSGGSGAASSLGVAPGNGAPTSGQSKLLSPQSSTLERTVSKMSSLSHPTAGSQDFLEKFHSDRLERQPTAPGAVPFPAAQRNPPSWTADPFASPKAQEQEGSPLIRAGRGLQSFLGRDHPPPPGACARVEEEDQEAGPPSVSAADTASLGEALGHSHEDLQLLLRKLRASVAALRDSISPQAPERARVQTRIPGPPLQRPARGLAPSLLRGASQARPGEAAAARPSEEVEVSDFEDCDAQAPARSKEARAARQPRRMARAQQDGGAPVPAPAQAGPSSQAAAERPDQERPSQAGGGRRGAHRKSVEGGTLSRKLRNLEAAWQELEASSQRKENEPAASNATPAPAAGAAPPALALQQRGAPAEAAATARAPERPQASPGPPAGAGLQQAPAAPKAAAAASAAAQPAPATAPPSEPLAAPVAAPPAVAIPGPPAVAAGPSSAVVAGPSSGAAQPGSASAAGISLPLPQGKPKKSLLKKLWQSSTASKAAKAAAAAPASVEGLRAQSELPSPGPAERPAKSKDSFSRLAGLFRRRSFSASPSPPPAAPAPGGRPALPPTRTLPSVAASVPQLSGRAATMAPVAASPSLGPRPAVAGPLAAPTQAIRRPPPPIRIPGNEPAGAEADVASKPAAAPAPAAADVAAQEAAAAAEAAAEAAEQQSAASDAGDGGGADGGWMSPERAVKSLLVPSWVPSKLPIRGIPPGEQAEGPLRSLESMQGTLIGAVSPRQVTLMPKAKRPDWKAAKVPFADFPVQGGGPAPGQAPRQPPPPRAAAPAPDGGSAPAAPMVQRAASSPQGLRPQPAPPAPPHTGPSERPAAPQPRPAAAEARPEPAKAKEGFFKALFKRRSDTGGKAGRAAAAAAALPARRVTDCGATHTLSYNRLPSMTARQLSARAATERPAALQPQHSSPAGAPQVGPQAAEPEFSFRSASPPRRLSPRPEARSRTPSAGRRRVTDEDLEGLQASYQSLTQTWERLPQRPPSRERQREPGQLRRRLPAAAAAYERAAGLALPGRESAVGTSEAVPFIMRKLGSPAAQPRPAADRPREEAAWEPESASLTAMRWAESLRGPSPGPSGAPPARSPTPGPQREPPASQPSASSLQEARLQLRLGQRATTPFGRVRCDPDRAVPVAKKGAPAAGGAIPQQLFEDLGASGAAQEPVRHDSPAAAAPSIEPAATDPAAARPAALVVDSGRPAFPALRAYLGAKSPGQSPSRDLAADPEIAACLGSSALQRRFQAGLLESHVVELQQQFESFSTARDRTAAWATQSTAQLLPHAEQQPAPAIARRSGSASTRGSSSPDGKAAAKPVRIKY